MRAITSLDQVTFADAFLAGDIDIDGDMLRPVQLCQSLGDRHPLTTVWRFLQPLLFGQVRTNRADDHVALRYRPQFFLSSWIPRPLATRRVSTRVPTETLDAATHPEVRLLVTTGRGWSPETVSRDRAGVGRLVRIRIAHAASSAPGSASRRRRSTISSSEARELGHDWELINVDLLAYQTDRKYDAIVIMGVIEHLPQYDRVLAKFATLLKPGGNIFLDGSACTRSTSCRPSW